MKNMSSMDKQVGGSHYQNFEIAPVEIAHRNKLGFTMGNVIKYAHRYTRKRDPKDLKKIIHYAQLTLEMDGHQDGNR